MILSKFDEWHTHCFGPERKVYRNGRYRKYKRISHKSYDSTWKNRFKFAELSKLFIFNCNFDEYGLCAYRREVDPEAIEFYKDTYKDKKLFIRLVRDYYKQYTPETRELRAMRIRLNEGSRVMCCCSGCYSRVGYLNVLPKNDQLRTRIAQYFNDRTGFWRPNVGCVLPRKYRSFVCLAHACAEDVIPSYTLRYFIVDSMRDSETKVLSRCKSKFDLELNNIDEVIEFLRKELHKQRRAYADSRRTD